MRKLLTIKVVLILSLTITHSQMPFGAFTDYRLLPNLDTLVLHRSYGDWWYGFFLNSAWNINFGKLRIPERPFLPLNDTINRLLTFNSRNRFNFAGGIVVEYLPKGSFWGGTCRITLLEGRLSRSDAIVSENNHYSALMDFRTIVISPAVRYNFKIEGLYAFAGFDIEYLFDDKSKLQQTEIKDGARLLTDWVLPAGVNNFRFGMNLGAGWEFFFLDIGKVFRARWKPFITFNFGTAYFSGYSSSLNSIFVRGGVSVTFGKDEIQKELRKYDSLYVKPPEAISSVPQSLRRGVYYSGVDSRRIYASLDIAYKEIERIFAELKLSEEEQIQTQIQVPERNLGVVIDPNQKIVLQGFNRSEVTTLTQSMRQTLDALAEFLATNPSYIVVIEGHSDNQGNPIQNLERSQLRSRNAYDYLVARGINPGRIRWAGRSSFVPIAENTTENGRRLNRRIEIIFIK
ncbi:MAG: OmpA family protein [Candidatus Kapaibacteriales bacterium]